MRALYVLTVALALAPACLLIQPLEDAKPGAAAGGQAGSASGGAGAGGSGGSKHCGLNFTNNCLNECADGVCCADVQACLNRKACDDLFTCVSRCPESDQACDDKCLADHPDGVPLFNTLISCLVGCDCLQNDGGAGGNGGAAGGAPADCKTSANPPSNRVQQCVYDLSCDPLVPPSTMSDCITFGPFYACAIIPASCADARTCKARGYASPSACEPLESGWKCAGDVAIRCGSGTPYSIDCNALGATCSLIGSGLVEEGFWPCALTTPIDCGTASPTDWKCAGDTRYRCVGGKAYGHDCFTWGQSCVEAEAGKAYCSTGNSTCTTPQFSCEAGALHLCDIDKRFGIYDCALSNTTCATDGSTVGYCLAPGCSKEQYNSCTESCLADGTARVCVGGSPYVIDCTEYGFSRCAEYEDHPVTQGTYVICE
jgi:hypothetical protein